MHVGEWHLAKTKTKSEFLQAVCELGVSICSACKGIFSSPGTPRRIGIDQIPDEQDTIPSCTKVK